MVTAIKGNATSTFGGNIDVPQIITDAPMFSASGSAAMTISNGVWTKIAFDTEQFDLTSDYDTTLYRFTPSVAGYYQFNALTHWDKTNTDSQIQVRLYKNGSPDNYLIYDNNLGASNDGGSGVRLEYANGTTDYFELYAVQQSGSNKSLYINSELSYFQGHLVRAV